jgi:hypothetical protein
MFHSDKEGQFSEKAIFDGMGLAWIGMVKEVHVCLMNGRGKGP